MSIRLEKTVSTGYADPRPVELIGGREYMMAVPYKYHSRVRSRLNSIFGNYLNGKRCEVYSQDIQLNVDDENHFIPDIAIICFPKIVPKNGEIVLPADLVVEILSPSTEKRDRVDKFNGYEKIGVTEYWIADPELKTIEVFLLNEGKFFLDRAYTNDDHISPSIFPDLSIGLEKLFDFDDYY